MPNKNRTLVISKNNPNQKLKYFQERSIIMDSKLRQKKELGTFFTPTHLANIFTKNVIDRYLTRCMNSFSSSKFSSLEEIFASNDLSIIGKLNDQLACLKILDGAAGDGEFLRACLIYLTKLKKRINKSIFSNEGNTPSTDNKPNLLFSSIFGMEIDSDVLARCHQNLSNVLPGDVPPSVTTTLQSNIIQGDFLESSLSSWPSCSIKGFNIIIGNPPWGGKLTSSQKDRFQSKFQLNSSKRNLNTFSLFVYQATRFLNYTGGILAFLLPKNVTRSNQYINLRKFIIENFEISEINFYGLFEDVTQEFISLIGFRTKNIPPDHEIIVDGKTRIPQTFYLKNIDYVFTRTYNAKSLTLVQRIHKNSQPLSEFLSIRRGEELSKRGGVMYCPHCLKWVALSSRKAEIVCSRCSQILDRENLEIQYLITTKVDSLHSQSILTGDDFESFKITSSHFINPNVEFESKKNIFTYKSPKLVVQKIKRVPCAAYDPSNHWTTQNVYNLSLVPKYEDNPNLLFFILAVLNSSLYHWYYESQFNLGSSYTNAISIRNLRRLPIKFDTENQKFQRIIDLTKKIIKEDDLIERSSILRNLDKLILEYYNCKNISLSIN
jgi:hypothetical protein